jgi:serine/threonine-protein kinase
VRLTVETGPLAGTVIPLDRAHPTLLGSSEQCAVRVQEPGVAAQHAVVKALREEGFGVKALAPGLRLNGAVIEASPLRDGDVLELGTTRIAFGQVQDRHLPRIPGYRLIEELGRGGMGIVYRAEQLSLHREVALKVLNRELTEDPAFVAKFVAEARAAAKLQHPNVVHVLDVEHDNDVYYYAMELMHEGSLEDWLKQHGAMPVDRALRVVADAAAGLAYAESLGIVHRDIKPDNLMLDRHGAVKIADLGLARTEAGDEERAIGTPHFMAPEQVLRKGIDHRTDLYALGCTFYRLVTGRTPFRGQAIKDILRAQVKDEAEPAHKVNPDVPAEVAAIIQKLMAKDPAARFQTANELLEQLETLLQPKAKRGLWMGLAAAGVLVATGAIWWAATKPTEYIEVEKTYDDPEKQQFADEIKRLKKAAREDAATIALLTARASGLPEAELASAFDRVAADHQGTGAAVEAGERAEAVRRQVAERSRLDEQRRAQVAQHLAALRQAAAPAIADKDFARAIAAIAAPAPDPLRGAAGLESGVQALRTEVMAAARDHLKALDAAIDSARTARDEQALAAACDAAGQAIAATSRWPDELRADLDAAKARIDAARAALEALAAERAGSAWQMYQARFAGDEGIGHHLRQQDFAAAAAAMTGVAESATEPAVRERARTFAAAALHAGAFADALERTIASNQPTMAHGEGAALQVVRWERAQRRFVTLDNSRRPPREQVVEAAAVPLEVWTALADQAQGAPPGSRECFLGFLTLITHTDAARTFLARLRADDDASGTGPDAYPLGAAALEQLLRRLPDQGGGDWATSLRAELQAGQRLTAGMRALSERRNLAAANHLDKLLAEHPHSCVIALLP